MPFVHANGLSTERNIAETVMAALGLDTSDFRLRDSLATKYVGPWIDTERGTFRQEMNQAAERKAFEIPIGCLVQLERILPELMRLRLQDGREMTDDERRKWAAVKAILSDVRWNGTASETQASV